MHSKALFSFVFIALFVLMQLELQTINAEKTKKLSNSVNQSIEAEKLNLIQSLIEENSDKIIEEKLQEALLLQQSDNEIIKLEANSELFAFFSELEKQYSSNPKIEFFFTEINSNNYETLFESLGEKLSLQKLNESSKVNVLNAYGKSIAAEYHFTGGMQKNKTIVGIISSENAKQLFVIPRDYTISKSVAG
ncbi:MAG: hypothetical protein Q7S21_00625 [archaeon]|nr:hypothetical protein [archaeon]